MNSQPSPHQPDESVGPYRLERLLGRGAAAEVWQVVETGDMGFTKRQALKLLQPPPGEMEAQKKALINEARVCGHLKHPGVVDVYRVGEHEGELYIAMEFVDGPDLNTLLVALRSRGIPIPVPAALDAAIDLCDALDYAHHAVGGEGAPLNIVHRDLKPSNVLVERRGSLKISDWGLVKSRLNLESTTRGVVKGTPGYIAPEVWGGTRDFQPTADLFAVGAMLYEFVVGERLFRGRNLARIAEQVARRQPEEEAQRVAERIPALVPVLARALQRVPARRHQAAAELGDELRAIREELTARETWKRFLRDHQPLLDEIAPHSTPGGAPRPVAPAPEPDEGLEDTDSDRPGPARLGPGAPGPEEPTIGQRRDVGMGTTDRLPAPPPGGMTKPMPVVDGQGGMRGPTVPMAAVDAAAASRPPPTDLAAQPPAVLPIAPPGPPSPPPAAPQESSAPAPAATREAPALGSTRQAEALAIPPDASASQDVGATRHMSPSDSLLPADGAPRRKRKRPAKNGRRGRAPVKKRPPPPTGAVVILVLGMLVFLAGVAAYLFLKR